MKRLTKMVPGLALLALLFATPTAAEEIVMVCTFPDQGWDYTLKYVDPLVGRKKVYSRSKKGWSDWLILSDSWVVVEYEVGDRILFMEVYKYRKKRADSPGDGLRKGDKFRYWSIVEADFEFLKFTEKFWFTKADGSPPNDCEGIACTSRKNPHINKYTCTKHDPK